MKRLLYLLITFYQVVLSPMMLVLFGHSCRYQKTCSQYSKEAIEKYGIIRGLRMGIRRILSCHPWAKTYV